MKFLNFEETGKSPRGINLDMVVSYRDDPERDEVALYQAYTGSGGLVYTTLKGENRRAFFDAIADHSVTPSSHALRVLHESLRDF